MSQRQGTAPADLGLAGCRRTGSLSPAGAGSKECLGQPGLGRQMPTGPHQSCLSPSSRPVLVGCVVALRPGSHQWGMGGCPEAFTYSVHGVLGTALSRW